MKIKHITELFSLDDRNFVIEAYQNLIGREPDEFGMRYYFGRLALGYDRQSVIYQLFRSPEVGDLTHIRGLSQLISQERFRQSWLGRFLRVLGFKKTLKSPDGYLRPLADIAEQLHSASTTQVNLAESLNRWGGSIEATIERLVIENYSAQVDSASHHAETSLSRSDVIQAFRQVLRRNPEGEATIHAHRGYASIEALSAHLKKTAEYQLRQESLCMPARRVYAVFCTALPVTDL